MDFGFIGSLHEFRQLSAWFSTESSHRLVCVSLEPVAQGRGPRLDADSTWQPPAGPTKLDSFEDLLTARQMEALILGGLVTERPERLRRITQLGWHCLCFHPLHGDPISYHEVAMSAADTRTVLMPWLTARLHETLIGLRSLCDTQNLGAAKFLVVERTVGKSGHELLAGTYAEAADLLLFINRDVTEVTATGDVAAERVVVMHRTESGVTAEVRLVPSLSLTDRWKVTLEAEHGIAEVVLEEGLAGGGSLRWSDRGATRELTTPAVGPLRALLNQFDRAVRGETHTPTWSDAIRAAELAEAVRLSLDRRRAIDVYPEKRNELASFKGRMTSLGCGLIWITLAMLIVLAAGKGLHIPGIDYVAMVLAIVWLLFVGLQALRWLFPADDRPPG